MTAFGTSASELVALAQFAYKTYGLIRTCETNFRGLGLDVECLLVNISCLKDEKTQVLVDKYIADDRSSLATCSAANTPTPRQSEIEALKAGLEDVVLPLVSMFVNHKDLFAAEAGRTRRELKKEDVKEMSDKIFEEFEKVEKKGTFRTWKISMWSRTAIAAFKLDDLTQIRSRCTLHAANLNLFMTRLMQAQLQRELETSREHTKMQLKLQNTMITSQLQKQYELQTLRSARELLIHANSRYTASIDEGVKKFERDVAAYVAHLIQGGRPFTTDGLAHAQGISSFSDPRRPLQQWTEEARLHDHISKNGRRMEDERYSDGLLAARPKLTIDMTARTKLVEACRRVAFATSGFLCDMCRDDIYIDDKYYVCPTHPKFDLCLDCYDNGNRCPRRSCKALVKTTMTK